MRFPEQFSALIRLCKDSGAFGFDKNTYTSLMSSQEFEKYNTTLKSLLWTWHRLWSKLMWNKSFFFSTLLYFHFRLKSWNYSLKSFYSTPLLFCMYPFSQETGFLPQFKNMHVRLSDECKLPLGLNVCMAHHLSHLSPMNQQEKTGI